MLIRKENNTFINQLLCTVIRCVNQFRVVKNKRVVMFVSGSGSTHAETNTQLQQNSRSALALRIFLYHVSVAIAVFSLMSLYHIKVGRDSSVVIAIWHYAYTVGFCCFARYTRVTQYVTKKTPDVSGSPQSYSLTAMLRRKNMEIKACYDMTSYRHVIRYRHFGRAFWFRLKVSTTMSITAHRSRQSYIPKDVKLRQKKLWKLKIMHKGTFRNYLELGLSWYTKTKNLIKPLKIKKHHPSPRKGDTFFCFCLNCP